MRVFAISDPHLSLTQGKSMDVFGQHWAGHWEKIKKSWEACVAPEDAVIIAGDLTHGFHGKRVRLLSSGQLVNFQLPCLWGDCLAAVFQFFQIPGCCVIQDQFPAVALLKLFPFFRFYFGKLLVKTNWLFVPR